MYWIVGTGKMAEDYLNVFQAMEKSALIIGRNETSSRDFAAKNAVQVVSGGFQNYLKTTSDRPHGLVIAVSIENLFDCCRTAIESGIKKILIEKPAGLNVSEIEKLEEMATNAKVDLLVAYNRRFYSSVRHLKKLLTQDGGLQSMSFEFTEWSHVIEKLQKPKEVLEAWFLANSTHVVDLAFHLGGMPSEMASFTGGKGKLKWHPAASMYCGAGRTENNVLFSYSSNWESAGRWAVELCTSNGRYYLKPLEDIFFQERGKIDLQKVPFENELDVKFKPGLYLQVEAFLKNDFTSMCTIKEHLKHTRFYAQIQSA